MNQAYLGLIGVLIGGLITIIGSIITFKKELTIWREQLKSQRTEKMETLKMEKYAKFLGAYFYLEGSIGDVIDILQNKQENALERLSEIAHEPAFENAIVTINNEKGWVFLLSKDADITFQLSEMESLYDEIQTNISRVRNKDLSIDDALKIVQEKQNRLKEISKTISELMRQDAICE